MLPDQVFGTSLVCDSSRSTALPPVSLKKCRDEAYRKRHQDKYKLPGCLQVQDKVERCKLNLVPGKIDGVAFEWAVDAYVRPIAGK